MVVSWKPRESTPLCKFVSNFDEPLMSLSSDIYPLPELLPIARPLAFDGDREERYGDHASSQTPIVIDNGRLLRKNNPP